MRGFLWIDRLGGVEAAEGDHLVGRVVADVGPAEPRDAVAFAPVSGDLFRALAEVRIVGFDVVDPTEPDPGDAPDGGAGGEVEQGPIGRIEMLRHLLEQQYVAFKVRL